MIHAVIEQWHAHMRGELKNGLDILLDDNCVFLSPIVFTPQVGKEITKMYLMAAGQTLPGEKTKSDEPKDITCNDEGKIIEFRVMMRPLQAINAVHRQMGEALQKMTK
jgi:hypothetical protein